MVCYAKLAQLAFALQILARTAKVQFLIYSQLASKNRALLSQNSQTQIKTNKNTFYISLQWRINFVYNNIVTRKISKIVAYFYKLKFSCSFLFVFLNFPKFFVKIYSNHFLNSTQILFLKIFAWI